MDLGSTPSKIDSDAKALRVYDSINATLINPSKRWQSLRRGLLLCLLSLVGVYYFHLRVPTPVLELISGPTTSSSSSPSPSSTADLASEIYPLRPQTPWDISTSFPYPRTLSYNVSEGTWLRLDVHPLSGDVVFDMAGDIWCLSAREVNANFRSGNGGGEEEGEDGGKASSTKKIKARPVITGVPFDTDPHFSPAGDKLVFRSDAELGVENIWVVPWAGCEGMDLRPEGPALGPGTNGEGFELWHGRNDALRQALELVSEEDALLASGVKETPERRRRRLIREGRWKGALIDPFSEFSREH